MDWASDRRRRAIAMVSAGGKLPNSTRTMHWTTAISFFSIRLTRTMFDTLAAMFQLNGPQ